MANVKAPRPEVSSFEVSDYIDPTPENVRRVIAQKPATLSRIVIDGPAGERASVFVAIGFEDGRWFAEIEHDATDYSRDGGPTVRRKRIPLTFHAAAL